MRSRESLAPHWADFLYELSHQAVEHHPRGFLAQFVAFQTVAPVPRRMIIFSRARVAETHHRPVAGGNIPIEMSIRLKLPRKIDQSPAWNGKALWQHGLV